jgi:hypothetical protein
MTSGSKPNEIPETYIDIVSTSEAGHAAYYRIVVYRQSDDATVNTADVKFISKDDKSAAADRV